jgi:hypothetical protein
MPKAKLKDLRRQLTIDDLLALPDAYARLPTSKREARERGSKLFLAIDMDHPGRIGFTCVRGHIPVRRVYGERCEICRQLGLDESPWQREQPRVLRTVRDLKRLTREVANATIYGLIDRAGFRLTAFAE